MRAVYFIDSRHTGCPIVRRQPGALRCRRHVRAHSPSIVRPQNRQRCSGAKGAVPAAERALPQPQG